LINERDIFLQNGTTCWCVYKNRVVLFVFQVIISQVRMMQTLGVNCETIQYFTIQIVLVVEQLVELVQV